MAKGQFATGTVEGTGAAINVQLGFVPSYVKVFNIDDDGTLWPTIEWVTGMAAASGWKTLKVADSGSTGNLSSAKITSAGISTYAGTEGANSAGFTIGADADVNVDGETIVYMAFGPDV
jgi:hypothetical protein